jgi:hypothetical protein
MKKIPNKIKKKKKTSLKDPKKVNSGAYILEKMFHINS